MKKYLLIALVALFCFTAGCAGSESAASPAAEPVPAAEPTPEPVSEPAPAPAPRSDVPVPDIITGKIEMENGGVMTFELYPDVAPESVSNFVFLARQGFYNGLKFHRIMDGFMIQGGCPDGDGGGNPGYSILGEFEANGVENNLSHNRGVMSMARGNDFNSAGSQFFICHGDPQFLDGNYAGFGMITSGMEIVDEIATVPVLDNNGKVAPADMPVIKTITIDGDFSMDEPKKLPR